MANSSDAVVSSYRERLTDAVPWRTLIAPAVYVVAGVALFQPFQYIAAKDEISYIAIAERYARGDILTAVNDYWAPLLSWVMAVPIALGFPSFGVAKVISLGAGLFTFFGVRALATTFGLDAGLRKLVDIVMVPFLLYAALTIVTPDLLLTGILVWYFSLIFDPSYADRRLAGLACGVLGALAYFCKSYALLFFLASFVLLTGLHFALTNDRSRRRALLRHGAVGLGAVLGAVIVWGALLYNKYDEPAFDTNATYNYAIVGPDSPGRPIFYFGFVPPPDERATSVWEEPHYFAERLESWSPLDSTRALEHQARLVKVNLQSNVDIVSDFSIFAVAVITGCVLLCIAPLRTLRLRFPVAAGLLTLALYPLGYLLVYTEERYLWPVLLLLVVMGTYLIQMLFRSSFFDSRARRAVVLAVFGISLLIHPLAELRAEINSGDGTMAIAESLESAGLDGARFASNSPDYNASLIVVHHLDGKYYGMAREGAAVDEVVEELRDHDIEYYLVWEEAVDHPALRPVREVRLGGRELNIFEVRPARGA